MQQVLAWLPFLLQGLGTTIVLASTTLVLSTALGLPLALIRRGRPPLATLGLAYSRVFRSIPELIVLFFAFFGLPTLGLNLSPFVAAVIGLTALNTAYMAEIIHAGLDAVPNTQWEAALSLGMSDVRTFVRIVLPQAVVIMIPTYASQATEIVKITSLASVIGVSELLGNSRSSISVIHAPLVVLAVAGLLYVLVNSALLGMEAIVEFRLKR